MTANQALYFLYVLTNLGFPLSSLIIFARVTTAN